MVKEEEDWNVGGEKWAGPRERETGGERLMLDVDAEVKVNLNLRCQ